jgi:hypothetical protein
MKKLAFVFLVCVSLTVFLAGSANAELVKYLGVYGRAVNISGTWYDGGVYAGIYKLEVDGVATDSFCIDLADAATPGSGAQYLPVPLYQAPDSSMGAMGVAKATDIAKLWDMAYDPGMSEDDAAALQLAIWEVLVDSVYDVASGGFSTTWGSRALAQTFLGNLSTHSGTANVYGLTNDTYQDFVTVPDHEPTSLLLIGTSLLCLVFVGRKRFA